MPVRDLENEPMLTNGNFSGNIDLRIYFLYNWTKLRKKVTVASRLFVSKSEA